MAVQISESPVVTVEGDNNQITTVQFRVAFKSHEWQGEEVWVGDMRVGTLYTYPQEGALPKLVGSHWGTTHNFGDRREAAFWFTKIYHVLAEG